MSYIKNMNILEDVDTVHSTLRKRRQAAVPERLMTTFRYQNILLFITNHNLIIAIIIIKTGPYSAIGCCRHCRHGLRGLTNEPENKKLN
jgi:hypothetical protein